MPESKHQWKQRGNYFGSSLAFERQTHKQTGQTYVERDKIDEQTHKDGNGLEIECR